MTVSDTLRLGWQRIATDLPVRHRPFGELFSGAPGHDQGVLATSPGYSGVLIHEEGRPFALQPTAYADGVPGTLAGEDRPWLVREPSRELYLQAGARVHGPHGIVYDPATRTVVRETLESWDRPIDRHPVFATPGYPPAKELPGLSLLLTTFGAQTFFHFMIEALPKLALAKPFLDRVDHVLVARYGETAKRRWLSRYIPPEKIVFIEELGHFHCAQLIYASRVARHFEPNPWCVTALRSLYPTIESAAPTRIVWLDRQHMPNRRIDWAGDLASRVERAEIVDFAKLDPTATATTCGAAQALVGFHGAAFSNMVFCPPGTLVIELATQPFHPWYSRLAQACGHRHHVIRVDEHGTQIGTAAKTINDLLRSA